jgi:hypothetical protein
MKSMLSDLRFVIEDFRTKDLLGFGEYISQLITKVNTAPARSLIGIVGDYGTGKSVMLENLKDAAGDDIQWVHFDAWKYPERNNLWEGFVLDFVRQVSPDDFKQVLKEIDGTSGDAKKKLIKVFGTAVGTVGNIFVAPGSGTAANKAIDALTYFANTSPARRVFQIQDILEKLLKKRAKKPIYVVVEDADRSGDAGIYFIETLSQFLKNIEVENTIKVFIPIARKSFLSDKHDAYIKALDLLEFFDLKGRALTEFVEKIFNPELLADEMQKHHLIEWLQRLAALYNLTIRDLKFIIRNSESQYRALQAKGHNPDARIVLVVESTKYIDENVGGEQRNAYDYILRNGYKVHNRTQVEMILYAIAQNITTENTTDILNDATSNDNIFRRQVRFVEKSRYTQANRDIDSGKPIQYEGQYTLPLYYIL